MRAPIQTIVFNRLLKATVASILINQTAIAGGFSLYTEGSGAEIGNFAAGAAAEGADASIGAYNPAGLVLLHHPQFVFSGVGVAPSTQLSGTSTFFITNPNPADNFSYVQSFSNLQGGKSAIVPALHYAHPLSNNSTFGLSITSPFGLSTNYPETSPIRYAATLTELMTLNVSPELGGKINQHLAIGAGLDLQWARVKFNRVLGLPNLGSQPTDLDSLTRNQGDSFGIGFHAGLLGLLNDEHTRLGINYQSNVKHQFYGTSTLMGPLADINDPSPTALFESNSLSSNPVSLPSTTTLSAYQDINDQFALLGSLIYTGWNSFRIVQLNNIAAFDAETFESTLVNSPSVENYKNAWRFAVGANYHLNPQWMLRCGAGFDQTPTVNAERDARLPDADRWAMSIGGHYQMKTNLGFDLGYTYLWANADPVLNKTDLLAPGATYNVKGDARVHAQLVGLQATWMMD